MEDMNIIILQISIPNNKIVPSIITTFTPEENYAMLQIGSNSISEARKSVIAFTNKKISEEYKFKINELENEINVEKQLAVRLNETMTSLYEDKINKLNEKIQRMACEILEKNKEPEEMMNEELSKIKNKYDLSLEESKKELEYKFNTKLEQIKIKTDVLIEEKDKQLILMSETFDKVTSKMMANNSNKSVHLGTKGENITFYDLASTFKDFNEFQIQDKHTETCAGDFHLHFENFDVLVDAKNYTSSVGKNQKDKIRRDLIKNEHINIAWLISLNTRITGHDRIPIMYEFINTKQCIVYVNNLIGDEVPDKLLRMTWMLSCVLNDKIKLSNMEDGEELSNLKNKYYNSLDKVKRMKSIIRELNSSMGKIKTQIDLLDDEILHILEMETNTTMETHYPKMDEWWNLNVEYTDDNNSFLVSTNLWHIFKQSNKLFVQHDGLNADDFKKYIMTKLSSDTYTMKSKTGSITINNHKLKNINGNTIGNSIKINPILKSTKNTYYVSEEIDNKIISDYQNTLDDVVQISCNNEIDVYKVVSILMKHSIISKRIEARGYESHTQSEEYQNKVISKSKK
jgi:hypothetical protein